MNDVLPNWTAAGRFKEACEAADAARDAGITHKEAVCEALRLTLCLVEDWRGDHRQEIADYLGTNAPKEGQDDVLAIVKHVFARQDKKQWNWHANALRQAIAENRTSDEVKAYFAQTPPTTAAQAWSKAHRRGRTGGATSEVAIPCELSLPPDLKPEQVRLVMRDGKPVLVIPLPRGQIPAATNKRAGKSGNRSPPSPAAH